MDTPSGITPEVSSQQGFNPAALRLTQNFQTVTRRIITTIPIRKPNKQEFIRVHSDPAWRFEAAILTSQEDRGDNYVVIPELYSELSLEAAPKCLFAGITRQANLFLWAIKLADETGKLDSWNQSALEAAKRAESAWIRVVPNMALGGYDLYEALGTLPEPEWPEDLAFEKILEIAFKGRVIDSADHPVLKRLRGEL